MTTHSLMLLPASTDKHALLQAFASHCRFTDDFGHNWDALWDALNDWLERQPMPFCLTLDGSEVQHLDGPDWQQCRQILDDACASWPEFSYRVERLATQTRP